MPRADGSLVGIAVPRVWCPRCKLLECACEPVATQPHEGWAAWAKQHSACGTPACCGQCSSATR